MKDEENAEEKWEAGGRARKGSGAGGGLGFGAADGIVRHAALDDDDDDGAINCGRSRSRSKHYDHATDAMKARK